MSVTAFLTDSTLCIGCKACEVACKEWNGVQEDGLNWSGFSYDNTGAVGHSTWRHVKFVENAPEPGLWRQRSRTQYLVIFIRRMQALRECGLPGSLSYRVDHSN